MEASDLISEKKAVAITSETSKWVNDVLVPKKETFDGKKSQCQFLSFVAVMIESRVKRGGDSLAEKFATFKKSINVVGV